MALQLEMGNPLAVIEATAEGFVVDNPGWKLTVMCKVHVDVDKASIAGVWKDPDSDGSTVPGNHSVKPAH